MPAIPKFTEENIQKLFGHEAAEDEDFARLREYFFKSKVYERIAADLPLRILVGHKGIGKSALFKIALAEDREKRGLFPILIRPDDLMGLGITQPDFLQQIRDWKRGLTEVIARKALSSFGLSSDDVIAKIANVGGKLVAFIGDAIRPLLEKAGATMNPVNRVIASNFAKNQIVTVYIDDLDRGWEGKREDIRRVSALLNAARDMCGEHVGLRFRIALRSDVYYLVRTSDESTDKIEGSVVWYTWTNHEILVLLVKRIETFFGRAPDEMQLMHMHQKSLASYLDPIMEPRFLGRGHWDNAPVHRILMSLIRKRPRDLVKLCTLAAQRAREDGVAKIGTAHLDGSFEEYSQGRIQDTINEYRTELPDVERLVMAMRPTKKDWAAGAAYVFTNDQLQKKLDRILQQGRFTFANNKIASAKQLAQFLYKINFLTARKTRDDGEIVRKYFEENRYLSSEVVEFGFDWEIHPAYRWALQPESLDQIFSDLQLSADD